MLFAVATFASAQDPAPGSALAAATSSIGTRPSSPLQVPEYELKAAMMLRFIRFTTWPTAALKAKQNIVVGILETDPLGKGGRAELAGKKVGSHRVTIKVITRPQDAKGVHVLFVPRTVKAARRDAALKSVGRQPILTIGEEKGFLAAGGMFNFVLRSRKVRFQIDSKRAQGRGLKISTKLLKLANKK